MKKSLKKNEYLILSFLLTFFIITLIFLVKKVTPFGNYSTLTIDFFHQYYPMLSELVDRVFKGSNLIYSFKMSTGLPFIRNYFNYMSSPLNVILIIFGKKKLLISLTFLIALKPSLSALSFTYFVQNKFKSKNILYVPISILYGLCSYYAAYYWNIMWTDGLIMIPLIALGIEYLINKKKYLLYIFSLAFLIISNYYIGYMGCIFSIIYFTILFLFNFKKDNYKYYFKVLLTYIISSIIVGLLCSFALLPILDNLSSISATTDSSIPSSMYYNFNFIDFISNHFSSSPLTMLKTELSNPPNISCGILCVFLFILFIINKNIKLKEKLCYIIILSIIALGFFIPIIDHIWHAFHTPNDLPYRFSFIYTFVLSLISTYSISNFKKIKPIFIFISYTIIMILILILTISESSRLSFNILLYNGIYISIYFILCLLYLFKSKIKNILCIVFLIAICSEVFISLYHNLDFSSDINYLQSTEEKISQLINNNSETTEFNRLENIDVITMNDSSLYGYYGITSFSSMMYENVAKSYYDLGTAGNYINSVQYLKNTPVFDIMFNIKYLMSTSNNLSNYTLENTIQDINLFKNNYDTHLFYLVNSGIKDYKLLNNNPILNQENFVKYTTGINSIFEKKSLKKNKTLSDDEFTLIKYDIKNIENEMYFYPEDNIEFFIIDDVLYYDTSKDDIIHYLNDNQLYTSTCDYSEKHIITFSSNIIYVGYNNYEKKDPSIYSINYNKMEEFNKTITSNTFITNEFKENYINVTCVANNNGTIYTSIPYDNRWNVYVNNKKVETFKIMDSMLGFDVLKGKNNIVLKYEEKYLKIGIIISVTTLTVLIVTYLHKKHLNKENN